ncbi:MAG: hypothetical protein ACKVP7_08150 [Hyphomicrobiaceae bacterium]
MHDTTPARAAPRFHFRQAIIWAGWIAYCLVAASVSAISVIAAYRYGVSTAGGESSSSWVQGAIFVAIDLFKLTVILVAPTLFARGAKSVAAGCYLVGLALAGLSVWSVMSLEVIGRASLSSEASILDRNLQQHLRDIQRLESELHAIDKLRPVAVVEADLAAMKRDRRWSLSAGCTDATSTASRDFCAGHDKLFGELAGAGRAAELRGRIDNIRATSSGVPQAKPANPEIILLAGILGIDQERVVFWRGLILAIMTETASAVALAAAGPLQPAPRTASNPVRQNEREQPTLEAHGLVHLPTITAHGSLGGQEVTQSSHRVSKTVEARSGQSRDVDRTLSEMRRSTPARYQSRRKASASLDTVEGETLHLTCPVNAGPTAPSSGVHLNSPQVEAVRDFFGMLDRDPAARIPFDELVRAYRVVRTHHGWPELSDITFGKLARGASEKVGGSRIRSNGTMYVGLRVPRAWTSSRPPAVVLSQVAQRASVSLGAGERLAVGSYAM